MLEPTASVDGGDGFTAIAQAYQLDDETVRRQLDRLAGLCAQICEAPIALVSLVLEDTQQFVGKSGMDIEGTPRAQSFCAHAMINGSLMTVPDARLDHRFVDNPLVTGAPNIRFYAGQPLVSPQGAPLGSFCVIDDKPRAGLSPAQAEALATLTEAAMALLEKWRQAAEHRRQNIASNTLLATMKQGFEVLVDALPQLVWASQPNGMADYFSAQWGKFTGQSVTASLGTGWMDFLHPEDLAKTQAAWGETVATSCSFAMNFRLRRHDGEYVWMLARSLPIRDANGDIVRWISTCTDIQGQVQASELLQMVSQELSHRIKNLFAVAQGLIAMTLRNHPELKPVAGEMQSRLQALGRAHDLVRPRFVSNVIGVSDPSLQQLLDTMMQPYASDQQPRWLITGDDLAIGEQATTPLALFIHEMGTNSVKYGALGSDHGHILITITRTDAIVIQWQENGGPPVIAPERRGFGYRLAELSIVRQLSGTLQFDWLPEGLLIIATIPAKSVASQGRLNATSSSVPLFAD